MADEIIGRISVGDGATFTPSVSSSGELSWTNNKNLPNPESVDIAQAVIDAGSLDSRYLQLSGGTMTGDILYNGLTNDVFRVGRTEGDGSYDIGWFNGNNGDGANIALRSAEFTGSGDAGEFVLIAKSGSASKSLKGKPDGTLTWNGTAISLNGHTHSYLPLSGGTMTGVITRNGIVVGTSSETSYTQYLGGTDNTSANIVLYGKNHSSQAGRVTIRAKDGSNDTALALTPAGGLTWGGLDIAPQTLTAVAFDDLSIPNNTRTSVGSFTLTKGTWLITTTVSFATASAGYRYVGISATATGNQLNRFSSVDVAAAPGSPTHVVFSMIHYVTATTTLYVTVQHTAGSAISTSNNGVRLFRLSPDA